MKKRMLAAVFAVMMVFGMAGCDGNTAAEQENQNEGQQMEESVDDAAEQKEAIVAQVEKMKEDLAVYAEVITPEEAIAAGMVTIAGEVTGMEKLEAFMNKEAESVILCQYTQKGGAVLDYMVHFDGEYLILTDRTRDGYTDEEKKGTEFIVQKFCDLKVFAEFKAKEDSNPVTIGVLTNDTALTADEFRDYWNGGKTTENQAYLLFVF